MLRVRRLKRETNHQLLKTLFRSMITASRKRKGFPKMAIRSRDSPWGMTVPKIAPIAIANRRNIVVLTEVKKDFISNEIETDSEEPVSEDFGLLIKSELQNYL
jgi:hypothetical protein